MHDAFPISTFSLEGIAAHRVQKMILFPPAWAKYRSPVELQWEKVPFNRERARQVPNDERGVYSFVVQPGIANHPACAYLLYVGQTARSFRERYQEYLSELRKGSESRRPHIAGMLTKWNGYLWFYYASIDDKNKILATEGALLDAYIPPTNVELPGTLRHKMAYIFGT